MTSKRKRQMDEFDFNKSDPEDENFDPSGDRPTRRTSKKPRASQSSGKRKRTDKYGGSDIDDDGDELSDSEADSFGDDGEEDEEDDDVPTNAAGRRSRKVTRQAQNYKEDSEDDLDDDVKSESSAQEAPKPKTKIVRLKVPPSAMASVPTRRSTRARTEDAEDFIELSNSGRHAVLSRDSRSKSPEAYARSMRTSRASKGIMKAPEPIEEATQETSGIIHDADEPDELSQDQEPEDGDQLTEKVEPVSGDVGHEEGGVEETVEITGEVEVDVEEVKEDDDDDDDDDVPVTRRTRGARTQAATANTEEAESDGAVQSTTQTRRLTRRAGKAKSLAEPSSDFEPGAESEDEAMASAHDDDAEDDPDSPSPRGRGRPGRRSGRSARSSRQGQNDSADEEPEFDIDELNEEARELRADSRSRRRRPREHSSIAYQEKNRRSRAKVNYYLPPLTSVNVDEEEPDDPAPTPSRKGGRGRGAASQIWERNLNSTFGPFGGGGGAGALLHGPWGTGAAGGVDSDSSDDEMMHRSNVPGGLVGMTPTSAAPGGGLLGGGAGLDASATPNVGKIKDRKALADADPLGVDMNVDFSKVGGLQGHIDQLKEMVQLPLLYPELYAKFGVTPPRGVLFHGPPGTGKTLLARALAASVGSEGQKISFYMRKGADALSKWVGEAEKQLRLLFEEARKTQPSIIFFDEIDGLAPVRSSKQEQIHASIVSTLLALMDGMDGRGQVIVIGATNRPDNIDPALRRPGRFDREFYFPLPDIEGRRSILNIHTKDWGLGEGFKQQLATNTKGYGGADLRALCTEAALNSIQRTYPQIYSTRDKLVVDADKITVHASDFMMAIKRLVPSSERSATSGARPLPTSIEPLMTAQFEEAKRILDQLLPRKKRLTALEEAMYEQVEDKDHGFGRETLHQEFERSRIFRPRFILHGRHGMGQNYLASGILHYFEGVHVQNFDLPSLLADGRPMEQVIVGLFTEVRRHKPSVIYIPNIDAWYSSLAGSLAFITFQTMLRSIPPTDPVLVLATAECEKGELDVRLFRDFFGFSAKNRMEIAGPQRLNRSNYFSTTLDYVMKNPRDFPDPENRKKRVLEILPLAPKPENTAPSKSEKKTLLKRDRQLLNVLKVQLQPIMDQINRKYKKFRQPVIQAGQIEYLFAESDPNFVRADLEGQAPRPFEIVRDKHGNDVLRETATGRTYYNLETTTIEERLSNGFYARPKDFLFDIRTLAKDAKHIGDKERTLKANELLSNVEVDVASIEAATAHVDWEAVYRRQLQRAKDAAEKERKKKALQSIVDRVQSDIATGNDSDSQGPIILGEPVPGSRTTARFQVRSPPREGSHPLSNGTSHPSGDTDVQMSGMGAGSRAMGPPRAGDASQGMTQISQRSAVTSLPPGVLPSQVINEASTTKTSDPSTHRSSNFSTQMTNGNHVHHDQSHVTDQNDEEIPDTAPVGRLSQLTSSDEAWLHSQAAALHATQLSGSHMAGSPTSSQSQHHPTPAKPIGMGIGDIVNDSPDEHHSSRVTGSSSQGLPLKESIESFLLEIVDKTSGCTIEQLEQINRDLMDEIWRTRNEWNRVKVLSEVARIFNDTIGDIEVMQGMDPLSQRQSDS